MVETNFILLYDSILFFFRIVYILLVFHCRIIWLALFFSFLTSHYKTIFSTWTLAIILALDTTTKDTTHAYTFPIKALFIFVRYNKYGVWKIPKGVQVYIYTRLLRNEDDDETTESPLLLNHGYLHCWDVFSAHVIYYFTRRKGITSSLFFPPTLKRFLFSLRYYGKSDDSSLSGGVFRHVTSRHVPSSFSSSARRCCWMKRCELVRFKQDNGIKPNRSSFSSWTSFCRRVGLEFWTLTDSRGIR